jgi:hypothetical protein
MTRILPRTPAYGDIVIVVPPDRDEDYISAWWRCRAIASRW